jgi:hypothetical protein
MWLTLKEIQRERAVARLRKKQKIVIGQPFAPIDTQPDGMEILFVNSSYVLEDNKELDILFFSGYSPDIPLIEQVINRGGAEITAAWFWDNHHLFTETITNAFLVDFSFAAHYYNSGYMHSKLLGWKGFMPLCPIAWSENQVREYRDMYFQRERRNELYGGYNSYAEWPDRDVWLNAVIASDIPTDIRIYKHGIEVHPYCTLSPQDKFSEWCGFKTVLCTSFGTNTTMRMFDSLLTGSVPIITGRIADLGMIFTQSDLEEYNIVYIEDESLDSLRQAYDYAIELYDRGGIEGAIKRSDFILNNHMPFNRVSSMARSILDI